MIFQDPARSLNPTMKVGAQITEAIRIHLPVGKAEAREQGIELLRKVRIPAPAQRFEEYPHQLSGGMRQRVMIAIALACHPALLIADEATTALDVTTQAQIMELLMSLQAELGMAIVMITHDMGLAATYADDVVVMYAGRVVERGVKHDVFYDAQHPYTWGLLGSIPRLDRPKPERLTAIRGMPPSLLRLPEGCAFGPRCPHRFDRCSQVPPLEDKLGNGHVDACFLDVEAKRDRRESTIHPELEAESA
jgi:oligopeptide/dipeptide ABC transporter ATP-binding protein